MESLRITAGMGDITSYETLVNAGADELFAGFVPFSWNKTYGNLLPLNRREVLFYHVQIGTLEDMKILRQKIDRYHIPVTITFNSLYYVKEQLPVIADYIRDLSALGFSDYIIADINLIRYLSKHRIPCRIHISGEIGEWNEYTLRLLLSLSNDTTRITRIIFHRKTDYRDIARCVSVGRSLDPALEFEAFCMNENCHYTGGYCNSLHCDEMVHLCQLEYRLSPQVSVPAAEYNDEEEDIPGETGCGLCAIEDLQALGITHLKVVGRGLSPECVARDIQAVKEVLRTGDPSLFRTKCHHACYYQKRV